MRQARVIILFGLVLAAAAPAAQTFAADSGPTPAASAAVPPNDDPWQGFNRGGFAIHQFLDRHFLRPAALVYGHVVPAPIREGLHNLLHNLNEPVVAANDIMQGRVKQASVTVARFAANSTFGVAGVFDVATGMGAPHHDNSFALTLGRAHIKPGPYLFIPLVGPSTVRDILGRIVDVGLDPIHWIRYRNSLEISVGRGAIGGLDTRLGVDQDLQAVLADATDPYATLRSVYLQNQQNKIDDTQGVAPQTLPDFGDSPPAPEPAAPAQPPAAQPPAATLAQPPQTSAALAPQSPNAKVAFVRTGDFRERLLDEDALL